MQVFTVVLSFKNTALIFLEILSIQYFTIFSCKQYDIITDLICIIEINISETNKDISKRNTPFFSILKGLSKCRNYLSLYMHFKINEQLSHHRCTKGPNKEIKENTLG